MANVDLRSLSTAHHPCAAQAERYDVQKSREKRRDADGGEVRAAKRKRRRERREVQGATDIVLKSTVASGGLGSAAESTFEMLFNGGWVFAGWVFFERHAGWVQLEIEFLLR